MQHADTPVVAIPRALLFPRMRRLAVSWFGRIGPLACALAIAGIAVGNARVAHASVPADTLYGTSGDHIVTVDQNDGSITALAPQPGLRFIALAFDSAGRLFVAGCNESDHPFCEAFADNLLMELDPLTGEIVETIGPVTDISGSRLLITALSVQPGTDVLFGFAWNLYDHSPSIWTIDKSTATATLVTSEVPAGCGYHGCSNFTEFAFGPNGTLYHTSTIQGYGYPLVLMTLDPSTGALLSSIPIDSFGQKGLAVRSDGIIFSIGSYRIPRPPGEPPPDLSFINFLMTIDPLTGVVTQLEAEEATRGAVIGLDFSPVVIESVEIDIKPGSESNPIHPAGRGNLPVAILSSDTFNVLDVDVTTLAFGPDAAAPSHDLAKSGTFEDHLRDVNDDGLTDLISHYRIENTGVEPDDAEACITGETLDGTRFEGCDVIKAVPGARRSRR